MTDQEIDERGRHNSSAELAEQGTPGKCLVCGKELPRGDELRDHVFSTHTIEEVHRALCSHRPRHTIREHRERGYDSIPRAWTTTPPEKPKDTR